MDLLQSSLVEMEKALAAGSVSSAELTQASLNAIEKAKILNAFLEVCPQHAIAQAKAADNERAAKKSPPKPLLGIPLAIKDMILTKGIRTTCASKMLENFVPPYSATVTEKLDAAGSAMVGKTNMDEFAMGSSNENSSFGHVYNPWDFKRVPGGSSGGSAAAVAAGLVPAALGTDTGGSIRQPASFCGIVGIKPTYGRVSRYGVVAFASSLDQVGVFTRTVEDCARVLEVIAGEDPLDATSAAIAVPKYAELIKQRSIKGLRVGLPKEYFVSGMQPDVKAAIEKAVSDLGKLGAEIVEISLPHTDAAVAVYYIIAPAEASSNLARYDGVRYGLRATDAKDLSEMYAKTRSLGFGEEVKRRIMLGTYVLSSGYYDAYYGKAQKVRTLIAQDFKNVFESKCDVIAAPASPTTAFNIGERSEDPISMYLNDIFTIPVNLAGLPALSLPCGFDTEGLPIGLQLIGKPWDETGLLSTAFAYEQSQQWATKRPPLVSDFFAGS